MFEKFITDYNEAIFDTDRELAMQVVQEALDEGVEPESSIFDLVVPAMNQMVQASIVEFDASLAQHWMSAQIASEVTEAMILKMESPPAPLGHIVIGTATGDLHTLGKRIVIGCLNAQMIQSTDLGVNVSAETFVDCAVDLNASVIAVSAMMAHTATGEDGPLGIRRLLRARRLEAKIKLVVGGAPFRFDPELYQAVGADYTADEGITAGHIITKLVQQEVPS